MPFATARSESQSLIDCPRPTFPAWVVAPAAVLLTLVQVGLAVFASGEPTIPDGWRSLYRWDGDWFASVIDRGYYLPAEPTRADAGNTPTNAILLAVTVQAPLSLANLLLIFFVASNLLALTDALNKNLPVLPTAMTIPSASIATRF